MEFYCQMEVPIEHFWDSVIHNVFPLQNTHKRILYACYQYVVATENVELNVLGSGAGYSNLQTNNFSSVWILLTE